MWGVVICEPLAGLDGVRGHILPVQKPFSVRGSGRSLVPTVLPGQDEGGGNGCCPAPQLAVSPRAVGMHVLIVGQSRLDWAISGHQLGCDVLFQGDLHLYLPTGPGLCALSTAAILQLQGVSPHSRYRQP